MKRLGIVVGLFLLSFMVNAQYADDALRWVFESGLVDAAAVGMSSRDEIDMNVAIANGEIVDKQVGAVPKSNLEAKLKPLL